jgi:RNA polymerase sigma factor (sigma-70 family)
MKDEDLEKARKCAYEYLRSMKASKEDAEDFAQDAVIRVFEMYKSGTLYLETIDNLTITIAKNKYLDSKKNYMNRNSFSFFHCDCLKGLPVNDYDDEIDDLFNTYINLLNDREKTIMGLKLERLSWKNIGELLQMKSSYARFIYSKSISKIKKHINDGKTGN